MATPITFTQLQNASADAQTLEVVVNGDENTDVTTRLGNTYPTLDKALKLIMQHGLVGSTPYKTYQDLVNANIPVNTYAVVTNDSDTSKNGLYLNDNGTLKYSELNTVPQLMTELNKLINFDNDFYDNQGRKVAWGVVDDEDKLGVWLAEDGTINASNIYTDDNGNVAWGVTDEENKLAIYVDDKGAFNIGNGLVVSAGNGFGFAITDSEGRAILLIDSQGNVLSSDNAATKKQLADLSNSFDETAKTLAPMLFTKTDYMHLFSYRQSLSHGTRCFNPINTTQPYQNVTFKTGVLDRDYENADYTSFIPLVEKDNGKGEAESPTSGFANGFVELQLKNGDTAEQWQMVGSAPGEGGRSVSYLSKGNSSRYADLLKQVSGAMATANKLSKTYSVWAVAWTQAEQDYEENTSRLTYKQRLVQLHDDLKADVQKITRQKFTPPLICYQIASHRYYKKLRNDLALALLDASFEHNDIMIACPMYQFDYSERDSLHLTAESSQMLGKYYARALDYVLKTGKKWQPLQVKNITVQGRVIDIEFTKTNLVFDTKLVTQTHNLGFDIWQNEVLQDIIANAKLADKSRVRIVLNADLPADAYLSYARGRDGDPFKSGRIDGARGNLRDSNGDTDNYTDRVGKKYMHNWCVAFETKLN